MKRHCSVAIALAVAVLTLSGMNAETSFALPSALLGASLFIERRVSLSEAAKIAGVNTSTVWRWSLKGVRGVKLRTASLGAKRYTTPAWLEEFGAACTAAAIGEKAVGTHTSLQCEAATRRTSHELASRHNV